jgi:hypothetical protein
MLLGMIFRLLPYRSSLWLRVFVVATTLKIISSECSDFPLNARTASSSTLLRGKPALVLALRLLERVCLHKIQKQDSR